MNAVLCQVKHVPPNANIWALIFCHLNKKFCTSFIFPNPNEIWFKQGRIHNNTCWQWDVAILPALVVD